MRIAAKNVNDSGVGVLLSWALNEGGTRYADFYDMWRPCCPPVIPMISVFWVSGWKRVNGIVQYPGWEYRRHYPSVLTTWETLYHESQVIQGDPVDLLRAVADALEQVLDQVAVPEIVLPRRNQWRVIDRREAVYRRQLRLQGPGAVRGTRRLIQELPAGLYSWADLTGATGQDESTLWAAIKSEVRAGRLARRKRFLWERKEAS